MFGLSGEKEVGTSPQHENKEAGKGGFITWTETVIFLQHLVIKKQC